MAPRHTLSHSTLERNVAVKDKLSMCRASALKSPSPQPIPTFMPSILGIHSGVCLTHMFSAASHRQHYILKKIGVSASPVVPNWTITYFDPIQVYFQKLLELIWQE